MNNLFIYRAAIITLLVTNLAVTIHFLANNHTQVSGNKHQMQSSNIDQPQLPAGLNEKLITEIFYSIIEPYNANDMEKLVSLLDPTVIKQFGKKELENELNKLYTLFGPIAEGFLEGVYPANNNLYKLNYGIGLTDTSNSGRKAILSITFLQDNCKYSIKGIFIRAADQKE